MKCDYLHRFPFKLGENPSYGKQGFSFAQTALHSSRGSFCTRSPNNQRIQWVSKKCLLPLVLSQGVKFWNVQRASDTARKGAWAASSSRKFHRSYLGNWGCEGNKQTLYLILLRGFREGAGCLALASWSWQWPRVWNQGHTRTPSCHLSHSPVCPVGSAHRL